MANTALAAPAVPLYVVVLDGYSAADGSTFRLESPMARAEAIALCDLANDQAEAMGLVGRWHAEYVA